VIIVGLGPAGKAVYEAISESLDTAVIDMNPRAAASVKPRPAHFLTGDATHESVLHHAGVDHARAVVVTIPHHETVRQVVRLARQLSPPVEIFARARYHRYAGSLMNEANVIADEETLTGEAMAVDLRRALGLPSRDPG
jgi:CPA2 family monovalent cation:H+ antiporter-2